MPPTWSRSARKKIGVSGGLWSEKAFTISVSDANEQPTDIALSNSSIAENQPAGTIVGSFSSTDPDAGDTGTYALVGGATALCSGADCGALLSGSPVSEAFRSRLQASR